MPLKLLIPLVLDFPRELSFFNETLHHPRASALPDLRKETESLVSPQFINQKYQ